MVAFRVRACLKMPSELIPPQDGLRHVKRLKWPMLYQEGRTKYRPAAVTMATGADGKTRYLVRSRANWTFRDTSSYCSPEKVSRTKGAHTSSQPIPPCSHTCHNYTGHDLPRERRGGGSRNVKQSGSFLQEKKSNNHIEEKKHEVKCTPRCMCGRRISNRQAC